MVVAVSLEWFARVFIVVLVEDNARWCSVLVMVTGKYTHNRPATFATRVRVCGGNTAGAPALSTLF